MDPGAAEAGQDGRDCEEYLDEEGYLVSLALTTVDTQLLIAKRLRPTWVVRGMGSMPQDRNFWRHRCRIKLIRY